VLRDMFRVVGRTDLLRQRGENALCLFQATAGKAKSLNQREREREREKGEEY